MTKEDILTFGGKEYRFISCSEISCRMFSSPAAVQEAFIKREIKEVRIRSKSGGLDVRVDLTQATFNMQFGKLIMTVPSAAVKPYKEEHSELSKGKKATVA